MNSEVRQATLGDHAKIKEIIQVSFPYFRFFANHSVDSEDGKTIVAETQGEISGFAQLIQFNIGACKYGCILWIAVHPSHRHQGVAFELTAAGVEVLKKDGAQRVFASTQRRNRAALATLQKSGFKKMGFMGLWRIFRWRIFEFYGDIWLAPGEVVLIHE